jgi:hypothetical protein
MARATFNQVSTAFTRIGYTLVKITGGYRPLGEKNKFKNLTEAQLWINEQVNIADNNLTSEQIHVADIYARTTTYDMVQRQLEDTLATCEPAVKAFQGWDVVENHTRTPVESMQECIDKTQELIDLLDKKYAEAVERELELEQKNKKPVYPCCVIDALQATEDEVWASYQMLDVQCFQDWRAIDTGTNDIYANQPLGTLEPATAIKTPNTLYESTVKQLKTALKTTNFDSSGAIYKALKAYIAAETDMTIKKEWDEYGCKVFVVRGYKEGSASRSIIAYNDCITLVIQSLVDDGWIPSNCLANYL